MNNQKLIQCKICSKIIPQQKEGANLSVCINCRQILSDAEKAKIEHEGNSAIKTFDSRKTVKAMREHVNVIFVGHSGSGKSTTIGHILYKNGGISNEALSKIEKFAKQFGRPSDKYSWIMDRLRPQREKGKTMDIKIAKIDGLKRIYTFFDLPGSIKFMKNMITGTSQGDCAVLLISAVPNQFQHKFNWGGEIKQQIITVFVMGIRRLIICINKMDLVCYSQSRFQHIKKQLLPYCQKTGFKPEKQVFLPISGWLGKNLTEKNTNNPEWYHGPTLLEYLQEVQIRKRTENKPLKMPIEDVYRIGGIGTVVVGKVQFGIIKKNMEIVVGPKKQIAAVKSIEAHHEQREQAYPGDYIGVCIKGIPRKDLRRGYIIGDPSNNPPEPVEQFRAQIVVLFHPSKISNGYTPIVHCHTASIPCKIVTILTKNDRKTGKTIEQNPPFLKTGNAGTVLMKPIKPFFVDHYRDFAILGRFLMRDSGLIVGAGVIDFIEHFQTPT